MIDNFEDKYWFLSNFYPVSIKYGTMTYPSVEHAYQAAKTNIPLEKWAVLHSGTAGQAKKYGHRITLRKDWEQVKIPIMRELLALKFENDPLRQMLLDTGEEEIIEGNYWNDTFWGVCRGQGENHLGELLMEVREQLKAKQRSEHVRS